MSRPTVPSRRVRPSAGVAVAADRRFRRSDLRPERRRLGRALLRAGRWALPFAALLAAGVWSVDILLQAEMLTVRHVVVRGNVRLSTEEVQALVDGVRGENILRVDFEAHRRRALDSPWIAAVSLSRVLPSTIDVHVIERVPMALARVGQQLFLVDHSGVVIDEYNARYRDIDLPIVDGLVASPGREGPLVELDRVRVTAAFLAALESRPDLRGRLSQVDVSNARNVVVMFDHEPVWLHLGDGQFVERLNAYLELAPTLAERFADIDYVDLRFGERIFVRSRGRTDRP